MYAYRLLENVFTNAVIGWAMQKDMRMILWAYATNLINDNTMLQNITQCFILPVVWLSFSKPKFSTAAMIQAKKARQ